MEIILLHQTGPLLIDPRWRLLYYTRQPFLCSPDGDYPTTPPSANLPQMEIPLLHQTGPLLIYFRWRIPYYTTPVNLPHMMITLLHHPC